MEVLVLAVFTASNLICFAIGAKVGQQAIRGEEVKMPSVNPLKAYREYQARKEAERKQSRDETILHNIDNYDGTAIGQKEVPRG